MEYTIDPSSIAICTILHYPHWYSGDRRSDTNTDKIRGDLALHTLKKSIHLGYITIAVYADDNEDFNKELSSIENLILVPRTSPKRSPAKRQAIKKAIAIPGIRAIVLTEAEKYSLIVDCIPSIAAPLLKGKADIVIPSRNPELFKETYPDYMYDSEIEGNFMYNEELKSHHVIPLDHEGFDMFFGPRAFVNNPEIADLFLHQYHIDIDNPEYTNLDFDQEDYSNTQYYPIVSALTQKKKVIAVEVPFTYPAIQKENEEEGARESFIEKRRNQRVGIIIELMHFMQSL